MPRVGGVGKPHLALPCTYLQDKEEETHAA